MDLPRDQSRERKQVDIQFLDIFIRPFSSVQNKVRFILHEPYDLEWA